MAYKWQLQLFWRTDAMRARLRALWVCDAVRTVPYPGIHAAHVSATKTAVNRTRYCRALLCTLLVLYRLVQH
jgi:hypothetical protein